MHRWANMLSLRDPEKNSTCLRSIHYKCPFRCIDRTLRGIVRFLEIEVQDKSQLACTRFRRHRVRCFDGRHIGGLLFQNMTGTRFQQVPYRGSAPVMQALLGGQIDFGIESAVTSLPQYRAGASRPLLSRARAG
jgi:hypothetical protein